MYIRRSKFLSIHHVIFHRGTYSREQCVGDSTRKVTKIYGRACDQLIEAGRADMKQISDGEGKLLMSDAWALICKRLRSPGIDSKASIPPAYVAWRADRTNRVIAPARQEHRLAESVPGLLNRLQIRALLYKDDVTVFPLLGVFFLRREEDADGVGEFMFMCDILGTCVLCGQILSPWQGVKSTPA